VALVSSNPQPLLPSQSSQLDKYKDLFDASHPDRAPTDTLSETTQGHRATDIHMLSTVPEEQESHGQNWDSTSGSRSSNNNMRGTKRGRPTEDEDNNDDGHDVVMVDVAADAGLDANTADGTHRAKRRAVDLTTAQQPPTVPQNPNPSTTTTSPTTTTSTQLPKLGAKHGAKPPSSSRHPLSTSTNHHKPDTDVNFLKAVNSTKRGKKLEDDFDREFNLLRIAKPKSTNTDRAASSAPDSAPTVTATTATTVAPWDAIDDFGDVGIRGNFMVVVEMDVQRGSSAKPAPSSRTNNDDAHPEWIGRSNFKRFKKVSIPLRPTLMND
jgi:hypothetical protein